LKRNKVMNEETRAQELMIAAIYGELSPDEEREFEGLIESDAAIRAEFEELSETRNVLEKWDVSAPTTGFVFVDPAETTPARKPGGLRNRLAGWFNSPIPTWGFAATSVALAVLILAGFRVDRVENGVAFRFGPETRQVTSPGQMASGSPLVQSPADNVLRPVSDLGGLTRDDLEMYSGGMVRIMSGMLDDYQEERNAEMAYILQRFYEEMRFDRKREYEELRAQMGGMGLGLMAEQSMTNAALQQLIEDRNQEAVPLNPYGGSPLNQNEDKKND
jgi:anti-sigma-K factor RskA